MEETNGRWIGIVGRGWKLRESTKDVRNGERIRLALRSSGTSDQWRTTERRTQFCSGCSSGRRIDGSVLPASGSCCGSSETATLSLVPWWRWRSTGSNAWLIHQSNFNLVASTGQSAAAAFGRFESTFNVSIGRSQFTSGRFGHFVFVPTHQHQ